MPLLDSWNGAPIEPFDEELAEGFLGKRVLIGITETTRSGEELARHEYHGKIAAASALGIDIELHGVNEGHCWRMPPWLLELQPVGPGVYRLRSTGESVEDPDFVFTMSIRKPLPQ